ncbi:MAG TPA: OB-fold nucleic acid binding domain-containing protein, partial [Candidatus Paceibacterota bacterium]
MKIPVSETPQYSGKTIELFGWIDVRRDHGKLIFFDLRDRSGKVQLVVTPADKELHVLAEKLRPEWVVKVRGKVAPRPEAMKNPKEATGEIELKVSGIQVLAESKTPPFDISGDGYEIGEDVRMQYRYLDLRRARLVRNLRERALVLKFMRDFLTERGFVEIETPILGKSTP